MILPPSSDPKAAADFFATWFDANEEQTCVITQLSPGLRKISRHVFATAMGMTMIMERPGALDEAIYDDGRQWNLYMGVGTLTGPMTGGKKGGKKDVREVPGVWLDLDTDKAGFFTDEAHALAFLGGLQLRPSIMVATGTGGIHAYWKTSKWLSGPQAEDLCTRWWAYTQEQAGVQIDKLVNCDRLMKLPGSIRWPKHDGEPATLVRMLSCDSVSYDPVQIRELADPAYERYLARIDAKRAEVRDRSVRAAYSAAGTTGWDLLMALQFLEDDFNEKYSWQDILIPLGWTQMDEDADGRTIWARPGLQSWELHKSAATDYAGSHVMSLFSDSKQTGLQELYEAEITLTKYRVYIQCVWNGDEEGFVKAYVEQMKRDGNDCRS